MGVWVMGPSQPLRFVERDGKRILQQFWSKGYWLSGEFRSGGDGEWRDVPLTTVDAPELVWSETGYT